MKTEFSEQNLLDSIYIENCIISNNYILNRCIKFSQKSKKNTVGYFIKYLSDINILSDNNKIIDIVLVLLQKDENGKLWILLADRIVTKLIFKNKINKSSALLFTKSPFFLRHKFAGRKWQHSFSTFCFLESIPENCSLIEF